MAFLNPESRPMSRLLPPLLVLCVLALIGVRWALEPSRAEAQERIRGLVQGGASEEASEALEQYLERFDTEEDVWFATWGWFRILRPDRAILQIWDHPTIPGRAETPRRFAETALFAVGWEDVARNDPTRQEPLALVALSEGDNAWAHERLRRHARELSLMAVTSYFFPAYRRATRGSLQMITEEFRQRDDERFHVAAAIGSMFGEDYPEVEADEKTLLAVIGDDKWRRTFRDVWCVSALALGRRGSPEGLAALERAAAELDGSVNEYDQQDQRLVYVGLLASGRFDLNEKIIPAVFGKDRAMTVTVWYLEALIHRYLLGDKRSELWLRRMWELDGRAMASVRDRIARAFLLQDRSPDDAAMETWVGRMLQDLEHPQASMMSHMLARSFRLRSGLPDAREQLVDLLRGIAAAFAEGGADVPSLFEPFIEGLRALYLYGDATTP